MIDAIEARQPGHPDVEEIVEETALEVRRRRRLGNPIDSREVLRQVALAALRAHGIDTTRIEPRVRRAP